MKSGMALKKREFTPESGNVDTYDIMVEPRIMVIIPKNTVTLAQAQFCDKQLHLNICSEQYSLNYILFSGILQGTIYVMVYSLYFTDLSMRWKTKAKRFVNKQRLHWLNAMFTTELWYHLIKKWTIFKIRILSICV